MSKVYTVEVTINLPTTVVVEAEWHAGLDQAIVKDVRYAGAQPHLSPRYFEEKAGSEGLEELDMAVAAAAARKWGGDHG